MTSTPSTTRTPAPANAVADGRGGWVVSAEHGPATVLGDLIENAKEDATSAERKIVRLLARLRGNIDRAEAAVTGGMRVPASTSGETFIAGDARDLDRSIRERQSAYDRAASLEGVLRKLAADAELDEIADALGIDLRPHSEEERQRRILARAEEFGLEVEPERCDYSLLAKDVITLSAMRADQRAAAVARLNVGEPIRDES